MRDFACVTGVNEIGVMESLKNDQTYMLLLLMQVMILQILWLP